MPDASHFIAFAAGVLIGCLFVGLLVVLSINRERDDG